VSSENANTAITVIVTGASEKGLGAGAAIALARAQPAHILLTARTAPKVQSVIKDINKINPLVKTSFIPIDLSEYDSVRKASKEIESKVEKIDILINNAGVMAIPNYTTNKDGVETTLATNHVGHFLLTNLLMDKIIAAGPGARIVNLTSAGHRISAFRFEDYNFSVG
jgi:NAD(P)-dependent dehydrogenase (short-subunit alcohol dehydrogenase family)